MGSAGSNFFSAILGGLVVLVAGGILIATDVIDTGDTTQVVKRDTITRTVSGDDGEGRTVSDIYEREGAGVVFIRSRGASSASPFSLPGQGSTATGSGFVVDKDGTIITNSHVVEGSDDVAVRFEENGEFVDAKVAGRDPSTDVAVLTVDPDDAKLRPLPLGRSSEVKVGDPVVAIGNPFGFTRTVTTGIVSALQRQIEAPNGFPIRNVIQTDASINPGNSGGPLFDAEGNVIGINSQIATGGASGSVGIGFAVPIDTVKSFIPELKRGASIERAYLGVEMAPVNNQVAEQLKLPAKRGALITSTVPDGPADKAGLRAGRPTAAEGTVAGGDLLAKVDGKTVNDPDDVAAAIADDKPGETIEVEYFRGKERKTVRVELGNRPSALENAGTGEDDGGGLIP